MWNTILESIAVLLSPSCWIQNYPFDAVWDRELTQLLDAGEKFRPVDLRLYDAQIGDYTVWIANHPYASFTLDEWRPRRYTILRAGLLLGQSPYWPKWPNPERRPTRQQQLLYSRYAQQQAAAAVDPSVADPGTPTTRV